MLHTTTEPHVSLSNLKFFKSADQNAVVYYNKLCCTMLSPLKSEKEMNNSLGCFLISKINTSVLFILMNIVEGDLLQKLQHLMHHCIRVNTLHFLSQWFVFFDYGFWSCPESWDLLHLSAAHVTQVFFLLDNQSCSCSIQVLKISKHMCGRKQCHIFTSWLFLG